MIIGLAAGSACRADMGKGPTVGRGVDGGSGPGTNSRSPSWLMFNRRRPSEAAMHGRFHPITGALNRVSIVNIDEVPDRTSVDQERLPVPGVPLVDFSCPAF